jgi:hypothetical protein
MGAFKTPAGMIRRGMIWSGLILSGVVLAWGAARLGRVMKRGGRARRLALIVPMLLVMLLAVTGFGGGGYMYWYTHRTQPEAERREVFRGVEYVRELRQAPRPMVIHVARVDLRAPGVRFLVTPPGGAEGYDLKARKTSAFLKEFKCQLAINANYFYPFRSNALWDYYPHKGDGVTLCGYAASEGNVYSDRRWRPGTLFLSKDNRASFEAPAGDVYNAISGNGFLVREGEVMPPPAGEEDKPYPRAALGLDAAGQHVLLIIIDGKQPGYSEGATLAELALIAKGLGGENVIRLDEGGSCALAYEPSPGRAELLNIPINNRVPYRERVVANHLGIYAERLR